MAKIVVVGSFNMDLTFDLERLPQVGETVTSRRLLTGPGGKGSNQAIAAARLGGAVTIIARIGQDAHGDAALALWKQEGIHADYVVRDPMLPTGLASILVDQDGNNMIATAPAANRALLPTDIDAAQAAIENCDVLLVQLEIPLQTASRAMQLAKRAHKTVILNPAPAREATLDLMAYVDVVTPNETELKHLYGHDAMSLAESDGTQYLLTSDEQTIVVTLGANGARWFKHSGTAAVPAFAVDVKDTTGAGDAFNGALAVALGEAMPLDTALRFANAAGALATTSYGAAASMPTRQHVEELLS